MLKPVMAAFFALAAAAAAQAHFPYIVPQGDGAAAKVVFSDTLDADANVNIEKIANTKLTLRNAAGKESPLEWSKGDACYLVNVPGTGVHVVYGTTDYGVLQKGEGKPFRLMYYPKAVVGGPSAAAVGAKQPLEVLADGGSAKPRFQVVAAGKPVSDAEVTVLLPGAGKQAVRTDKDGFTPAFDQAGRYGVQAKWIEVKVGEHAGLKYDEIRHYATLVVDVGPRK